MHFGVSQEQCNVIGSSEESGLGSNPHVSCSRLRAGDEVPFHSQVSNDTLVSYSGPSLQG